MLILCTRGIKRSVYCIAMVYASYFCTFYSCNSGTHPTFVVSVLMLACTRYYCNCTTIKPRFCFRLFIIVLHWGARSSPH